GRRRGCRRGAFRRRRFGKGRRRVGRRRGRGVIRFLELPGISHCRTDHPSRGSLSCTPCSEDSSSFPPCYFSLWSRLRRKPSRRRRLPRLLCKRALPRTTKSRKQSTLTIFS